MTEKLNYKPEELTWTTTKAWADVANNSHYVNGPLAWMINLINDLSNKFQIPKQDLKIETGFNEGLVVTVKVKNYKLTPYHVNTNALSIGDEIFNHFKMCIEDDQLWKIEYMGYD
jgi:hypothetical protein